MARVLHVLAQRPGVTGSGITLDALVRHAAATGWEQRVVLGLPADETPSSLGGLDATAITAVRFDTPELPFPVAGMSDVMPYPSSRFSTLSAVELEAYRQAWRRHLAAVVAEVRPHLIHSHHLWLVSSWLKDLAPGVPVVVHCHATGLRQMELCPHLADEVCRGLAGADRFVALHAGHAAALRRRLGIGPERVAVVGAGYREDLFTAGPARVDRGSTLLYVGKLAAAKGLPQLLDAVARLRRRHPSLVLEVAGSGGGVEAEALRRRMAAMAPTVRMHGQLDQAALAGLMRRAAVCVLPSFYEGLPLVLVEALACGCRLVATALEGVVRELAPLHGDALLLVPAPPMVAVDTPDPAALPAFTEALEDRLGRALAAGPGAPDPDMLAPFRWGSVFARVESVWRELLTRSGACRPSDRSDRG